MLVVQILITLFSAGGLVLLLVTLPGGLSSPHLLALAGLVLTGISMFFKRKWLKSLLFITGALSFALFLGYVIMVMNAVAAAGS